MADPGGNGKVLVIRLSSLGDIVRAVPSLHRLSSTFKRVDLLVEDRFLAVAGLYPVADRTIVFPRRELSPGTFLRFMRELRSCRYDLCLDLHGILKSAAFARMSKAVKTAGYAKGFGKECSHLFYGSRLSCGESTMISRYERYSGALDALGLPPDDAAGFYPPRLDSPAEEFAETFLLQSGLERSGFVFLFIGASRKQSFKRWPPEKFRRLAGLIRERLQLRAVLGFGPEESELLDEFSKYRDVDILHPENLEKTAAVIMASKGFVGADTGLMHMAALGGIPTVALMGATSPVLNRPWGHRSAMVVGNGMADISENNVLESLAGLL